MRSPATPHQLYQEVQGWPAPVPGPLLQLPAGINTLQARLPSWTTLPYPSTMSDPQVRALIDYFSILLRDVLTTAPLS